MRREPGTSQISPQRPRRFCVSTAQRPHLTRTGPWLAVIDQGGLLGSGASGTAQYIHDGQCGMASTKYIPPRPTFEPIAIGVVPTVTPPSPFSAKADPVLVVRYESTTFRSQDPGEASHLSFTHLSSHPTRPCRSTAPNYTRYTVQQLGTGFLVWLVAARECEFDSEPRVPEFSVFAASESTLVGAGAAAVADWLSLFGKKGNPATGSIRPPCLRRPTASSQAVSLVQVRDFRSSVHPSQACRRPPTATPRTRQRPP